MKKERGSTHENVLDIMRSLPLRKYVGHEVTVFVKQQPYHLGTLVEVDISTHSISILHLGCKLTFDLDMVDSIKTELFPISKNIRETIWSRTCSIV